MPRTVAPGNWRARARATRRQHRHPSVPGEVLCPRSAGRVACRSRRSPPRVNGEDFGGAFLRARHRTASPALPATVTAGVPDSTGSTSGCRLAVRTRASTAAVVVAVVVVVVVRPSLLLRVALAVVSSAGQMENKTNIRGDFPRYLSKRIRAPRVVTAGTIYSLGWSVDDIKYLYVPITVTRVDVLFS